MSDGGTLVALVALVTRVSRLGAMMRGIPNSSLKLNTR